MFGRDNRRCAGDRDLLPGRAWTDRKIQSEAVACTHRNSGSPGIGETRLAGGQCVRTWNQLQEHEDARGIAGGRVRNSRRRIQRNHLSAGDRGAGVVRYQPADLAVGRLRVQVKAAARKRNEKSEKESNSSE